jgi:hypothetical protein
LLTAVFYSEVKKAIKEMRDKRATGIMICVGMYPYY